MNIPVLCTGSSTRSTFLECLLRRLGQGKINAFSAGCETSGKVHPLFLVLLAAKGFETDGLSSKSWDFFAQPHARKVDATALQPHLRGSGLVP